MDADSIKYANLVFLIIDPNPNPGPCFPPLSIMLIAGGNCHDSVPSSS